GLRGRLHREPGLLGLRDRLGVRLEPDPHLDTGVAEVLRVRVPLRAVPDNGDFLALDDGEVRVFVVEDLGHGVCSLRVVRSRYALRATRPAVFGSVSPDVWRWFRDDSASPNPSTTCSALEDSVCDGFGSAPDGEQ